MRILIGLAILVILALAASSRRFWSLRRTRLGAALTTGGWLMVGVGMVVGPHGAQLIREEQTHVLHSLILFLIGWVGLIIGFGADRRLPSVVPRYVWRLTALDVVLSLCLFGSATVAVLYYWAIPWRQTLPLALLLGAGGVSWSAEVRSLLGGTTVRGPVTRTLRATSGIGVIIAVVIYGLLLVAPPLRDNARPVTEGWMMAHAFFKDLLVALLIGTTMGAMGMWLMNLAGRGPAEFLVVLVGLVSLVSGAAATMDQSPLFVALISGAVVANLPNRELELFKRAILEAEQPVAMALMLAVGVLANPWIGAEGATLVIVMVLVRVVLKLGVMRPVTRRAMTLAGSPPELAGMMRQHPLAMALAVSFALGGEKVGLIDGGRALTIIILVGLVSEAWPFLHRLGRRTATSAAAEAGA